MGIGKWCMYATAVLFIIIGVGALVVAVVPGAHEWVAEQTVDATTPDFIEEDESFEDASVAAIVDSDGVVLTAWILAATFLPTALLFIWIGRWFGTMQREGFGGMPYNPQAGGVAMTQSGAPVPHTSPMPGGQAPVPKFTDPVGPPPEGFIR